MSTPAPTDDPLEALVNDASRELGVEPGLRAAQDAVRPVDFRRPHQFSGEVQRRLRRLIETFCRTASSRLSAELRTAVDLEVVAVDQVAWADAQERTPGTAITATVTTDAGAPRLFVCGELELLLPAIERMLGGSGEKMPPTRRLTDIDMTLVAEIFDLLVGQLSVIWSESLEEQLTIGTLVVQQQAGQLATTSEPTLVLTVEAQLLETQSALTILIPFRSIGGLIDRLVVAEGIEQDDGTTAVAMRRGVGTVDLEVRAEAGAVDLPLRDVLAIGPGSVVGLGGDAEVTLYIDHTAVAIGRPGRSGSRRAIQVAGTLGAPLA